MESVVHETILDERLGALEGARAWNPRVISKLESHIRTADDVALFRINPIRFAAEKNIAEAEAIDLFLHGAFLGLFEMDWLSSCSSKTSGAHESNLSRNGAEGLAHQQVKPPSTGTTAPVMRLAASEARNTTALATSWACPKRPMGVSRNQASIQSLLAGLAMTIGVSM
jgi:hypothetical protein